MRFIFLLIILSFNPVFSQNKFANDISRTHAVALLSSVERNDIYTTFAYVNTGKSFSYTPSIGLGLIHSVFQNNALIRVGCAAHYNWLNKEFKNSKKCVMGTGLGVYYSFYREPVHTNFYDLKLGYMLHYGSRFKVVHSASFGWLRESFNGNTKSVVLNYPNFALTIGIAYEI